MSNQLSTDAYRKRAIDNLTSNNYELSNQILSIVNNVLTQTVIMSQEINDPKDSRDILATVKSCADLVGLVPSNPDTKIDFNFKVMGFDFIEVDVQQVKTLDYEE